MKLTAPRLHKNKDMQQPQGNDVTTCNRWEKVTRSLQFNNERKFILSPIPRGRELSDKLFKVYSLEKRIRQGILLVRSEEFLAIEQIISIKVRHESQTV